MIFNTNILSNTKHGKLILRVKEIVNAIVAVAIVCVFIMAIYLMGSFLYKLTDRTCVERTSFDTTDQIIGAAGSYCSKWRQN